MICPFRARAAAALPALALTATAGCTALPAASQRPATDLALGEAGQAGGATVRPIAVVQDSRCPADARCIWAGTVVVRTEIRSGPVPRLEDVELGKPVRLANGTLTLVAVRPVPLSARAMPPASYRFDYRFD